MADQPHGTERYKQKRLLDIRVRVKRRAELKREIDELVADLKSPGLDGHCIATWTEVGDALGVGRTAAQKHYQGFSWGGEGWTDGDE